MKRVIWCIVGKGGGQLPVNGVSCRGSRKSRHLNKTASGKIPLKPSEACFPAVEQVGVVHSLAAPSALWEPSSKKKWSACSPPPSLNQLPAQFLRVICKAERERMSLDIQVLNVYNMAEVASELCLSIKCSADLKLTFGEEREHTRTPAE